MVKIIGSGPGEPADAIVPGRTHAIVQDFCLCHIQPGGAVLAVLPVLGDGITAVGIFRIIINGDRIADQPLQIRDG